MNCSRLNVIPTSLWRQHNVVDNTQTSYGRWNDYIRPWKVDAIQKSGLSKYFVDSKKSTASASFLLFVEKLYLDDPYNKMFTISSSQ